MNEIVKGGNRLKELKFRKIKRLISIACLFNVTEKLTKPDVLLNFFPWDF